MTRIALTIGLLCASAATAMADGWVDCNGPDKSGRGCSTSGRDSASTGVALGVAGLVAVRLAQRRTRGGRHGDPDRR